MRIVRAARGKASVGFFIKAAGKGRYLVREAATPDTYDDANVPGK